MGLLVAGFIAVFGWNWLRGPIERITLERTGRALVLQGDLTLSPAWPSPRFHAADVSFANPTWATSSQMVTATRVEVTVDLLQLLQGRVVFPRVHLESPVVLLERSVQGRKSWLMDMNQQDESARIQIGRLTLDQGILGYDDSNAKTHLRATLSTLLVPLSQAVEPASHALTNGDDVRFNATGQFNGLTLKASGTGGPVMSLRDETAPYPLKLDASVGQTSVRANGTITSLLKLVEIDMHMALKGQSLEQLFPILGLAAPATRPYAVEGHFVHAAKAWRFDKFSGHVGASDIAGSMLIDLGGKRPMLKADLVSQVLDIEDLGPLIGARPGSIKAARHASAPVPLASAPRVPATAAGRVLPDLPFKTDRWSSLDADVKLSAKAIRRPAALPLENLVTHVTLQDSVMTLDPLNFGFAAGQLEGVVSLDGRSHPIAARAKVRARKIQIASLMPTVKLNQSSIGQINGEFDLAGQGDSIGQMLASSNGKLRLVVAKGEISKLMMETAGLHLWEILELKLSGDRPIKLRCGVADFKVAQGVMQVQSLIFDTEVTTLSGSGSIDLGKEQLDIVLNQKTKNTSPLSLRSPIYVRGTFAQPQVGVNKGMVAARALGALALGVVNPLLALVPLVDPGPGQDSDCALLVRDARGPNQSK